MGTFRDSCASVWSYRKVYTLMLVLYNQSEDEPVPRLKHEADAHLNGGGYCALTTSHSWLLLGLKQRGFGRGRWNGFGGKVQSDDKSPKHAALRELQEESGLDVPIDDVDEVGRLWFTFTGKEECMEVHLFMCRNWKPTGTDDSAWPCNTEEMHPRWFPVGQMHPDNDRQSGLDLSAIPFKHMWPDDRIWFHRVLNNDRILGWVHCAPLSSTDPVQSGLIRDSMKETNGLTIDPFEIPAYQLQCFPPDSEKKVAPDRRRKFIQSVIDQLGLASDERLRQWMRSGSILDSWKSELLVFG